MKKMFNTIKSFPVRHHAKKVEELYEKYEYRVGPIVMLIGVTVDFIAFKRIDILFNTLMLVGYLVIAAAGITLVNFYEGGVIKGKALDRMRMWLPLVMQFAFGNLFSAFVVFYLKSASFSVSWPFFVLLLLLVVGNEFFRTRYVRFTFHMSIYFLALFSFAMFYLPVVFKSLSVGIFILSGAVSLVLIAGFAYGLYRVIPQRIVQARTALIASIGALYFLVNFLYAANIIPPIPLALKEGGVYHSVKHSGSTYVVLAEEKKWYEQIFSRSTVHVMPDDAVYVFTAVFAPTDLHTPVQHHWQYKNPSTKEWITTDIISYPIVGGRDGGYRGYSYKQNTFPGDWRVDIETENGQVIGRVSFNIVAASAQPELIIKNY